MVSSACPGGGGDALPAARIVELLKKANSRLQVGDASGIPPPTGCVHNDYGMPEQSQSGLRVADRARQRRADGGEEDFEK